jgi:serine/threonine protein kinase
MRGDVQLQDFSFVNRICDCSAEDNWIRNGECPAPELVNHGYYDEKIDIWDIRVFAHKCVTGRIPSPQDNLDDLKKEGVSQESIDLLKSMREPNPIRRVSVDEVKSHPSLAPLVSSILGAYEEHCPQCCSASS